MPAPATAHRHVFRYSRGKTIGWLMCFILLCPLMLFGSTTPYLLTGKPAALWLTAIAALPFVFVFRHLWKQLHHREPVLELDDQGLVDHRSPGRRVRWSSLAQIGHATLRSSQVMSLTFIDSATADALFGSRRLLGAISMRVDGILTGDRPHAAIEISGLDESPRRIVQIAQALHARARAGAQAAGAGVKR